jgi:hypothetical protein
MKKLYLKPVIKTVPIKTMYHLCQASGSGNTTGDVHIPGGDDQGIIKDDGESGGPTSREIHWDL